MSSWENNCFIMAIVHLSVKPAMLCFLIATLRPVAPRQQGMAAAVMHAVVLQQHGECPECRHEQQPSRQSNRSNSLVKVWVEITSIVPKSASFAGLDSLHVDLFASSVPQRESLSCLCAKLNIGLLLGNLIFHRPGNNIFLREPQPSISRRSTLAGEPFHLPSS